MREFTVLVAIGLGTYLMRACFLVLPIHPPPSLAQGLPFVGPAVLAAIVAPGIVAPATSGSPTALVPSLIAVATTVLVWRRTTSFPASLLSGMGVWWVLGLL